MASDTKISDLTTYSTPISGDVLPINDTTNAVTKKITVDGLFNMLSSLFRIKDSSDTTKKIAFSASSITTATTRTVTVPDADLTMVGIDTTQTLTNKTLTAPIITSPTLTVGSDATGDIYYNGGSGVLARLARGTDNQILKMNGTALNWEAETALDNASTTVKGVVEAATAAEVTAGTATGGTGAVLAVTPDALASSTPVFNASGLTSVPSGKLNLVTTDVTLSSSTTETDILNYSLAGGVLGTNNAVKVTIYFSELKGFNTGTVTLRFKYGATTLVSHVFGGVETFSFSGKVEFILAGSGATNSQNGVTFISLGAGGYVGNGNLEPQYFSVSSQGTSAIDSTASGTIVVSGQMSASSASDGYTATMIITEVIR